MKNRSVQPASKAAESHSGDPKRIFKRVVHSEPISNQMNGEATLLCSQLYPFCSPFQKYVNMTPSVYHLNLLWFWVAGLNWIICKRSDFFHFKWKKFSLSSVFQWWNGSLPIGPERILTLKESANDLSWTLWDFRLLRAC